ncbi:MAG: hypothetical protein KDA79_13210 [Planctomycetaceae bacterium]|nr:hypothetical protein [Planctomycetaceae bacterium]
MRQFCTLLLTAAFLVGCGQSGDEVTTADPAAGDAAPADAASPETLPADSAAAETAPVDPAADDTPPADAPPAEPAPVDAPPAEPAAPPADSDSPAASTPAATPTEDKSKPASPPEGAVLPAMQDFMKALDGSEDGVAAAYKKHAAENADNPDDIDLMLLEKPKVLKTEMKDGQTCYTLETHAGISIRIWEICWKDGKISSAVLKDTKFP